MYILSSHILTYINILIWSSDISQERMAECLKHKAGAQNIWALFFEISEISSVILGKSLRASAKTTLKALHTAGQHTGFQAVHRIQMPL